MSDEVCDGSGICDFSGADITEQARAAFREQAGSPMSVNALIREIERFIRLEHIQYHSRQAIIRRQLDEQRASVGQGLAEYALIIALIAVVAIVALLYLGSQISAILSTIGQTL